MLAKPIAGANVRLRTLHFCLLGSSLLFHSLFFQLDIILFYFIFSDFTLWFLASRLPYDFLGFRVKDYGLWVWLLHQPNMQFVIIDHPTIMRIVQTCIFGSLEPCSCNFWFFLNSTISFYVGSKLCVNQTKSSMILLTRKQSAIVCPIHGGIFLENLLPLRPRLWILVQVCKVVGSSPKRSLLLNLKNVR